MPKCPVCGELIPAKSNCWVSAPTESERVCRGCRDWAGAAFKRLRRLKLLRTLFND